MDVQPFFTLLWEVVGEQLYYKLFIAGVNICWDTFFISEVGGLGFEGEDLQL